MPDWQLGLAMVTAGLVCTGTAIACRDHFRRSLVRQMLSATLVAAGLWCLAAAAETWGVDPDVEHVLRRVALLGASGAVGALWCLARVVTEPTWRPSRIALGGVWVAGAVVLVGAAEVGAPLAALGSGPGAADAQRLLRAVVSVSWDRVLLTGVMIAAFGRLFRARAHVPHFARSALRTVSFAIVLAALSAGATVPVPDVLGGVDYAPLGTALAGLVAADVLMRRQYLRIAPPSAEQVLESLTDAVVVLGPNGRILSVNDAARQLVVGPAARLPVELLLGWPAGEVLHPALASAVESPHGFTASLRLASGVSFDARAHVLVDRMGDPLGVVVVAREVSALVALNAQVRAAYASLEHERSRVDSVVSRLLTELSDTEQERTQLAEDVVRDALTGVHNRRRLEPAIGAAIERSRASGQSFAVLMLDIDHFKSVNDTHGHPVGDRVLQVLARELMIATRRGETVVRYGGEEFVVVIPGVGPFDAIRRANEIRRAVAALRVPIRTDDQGGDRGVRGDLEVTVSIGVSTYPAYGQTAGELIAAADDALFAAKAGGRNCVVAA